MRVKIFCILLITKIGTQVHASSRSFDDFKALVEANKGNSIQTALCRLKRVEDAVPSFLGALSTTHPQLVKDFFSMIDSRPKEEMLKALGLATEEATAKAREESAGALATLTSEKQALQASNEDLRREIDALRREVDARNAQIAEERKRTQVEKDRVKEVLRDRATTGRAADAEKAGLSAQIRELRERLEKTEEQLTEYKKMFNDQLLELGAEEALGKQQIVNRIQEARAKKKPSSLEAKTASLSPASSPSASPMSTPVGSLVGTPPQPPRSASALVDTSLGDSTLSSAAATPPNEGGVFGSLRRRLSGKMPLTSPISGSRTLPRTPSQASPLGTVPVFTSPVVPARALVDRDPRRSSDETGTASDPSSTTGDDTLTYPPGGPQGGSVGKDRRKPSLTVYTGEQPAGGVTEEDPDA